MLMKISQKKLYCLIVLITGILTTGIPAFSQNNGEEEPYFSFGIFESLNDSIDLRSNFYDETDSLSQFFPAYEIYESWDNNGIHYPKVDFTLKTDTTVILLADGKTNFYIHPHSGRINSEFGWRRRRFHYGIDIDLEIGDTVKAAFDGMVRVSKFHKGYGNVIVLRHFNGLETIYAHLALSRVMENQTVKAGEMIGFGGNTGRSTGPHLHFEVRYLGTPFNPRKIIDFENKQLHSDTLFLSRETFNIKGKTGVARYQGSQTSQAPPVTGKTQYHYVKKGETLGHIAVKYNTSVSTLCRLNGLTSKSLLQIGQKIRVR
jgi:hypothetical protein